MDWREEKVIEYIIANPDCTRTSVKNGCIKHMGYAKADKILKKLIGEGKVFCEIDKVNPRIHHLRVSTPFLPTFQSEMKMKNLLVSKVKEEINSQIFTSAELVDGRLAISPVNHTIRVNLMSAMQRIRTRIKTKRPIGY